MRSMLARTAPIVVATVSLAVIVTPRAAAATSDVTIGGCSLSSVANPAAPGSYTGVMRDNSTTEGRDGLPTAATVSCKLAEDGVDVPGTEFASSGFGVQAGAEPVSFTVDDPFAFVGACQRTVYADGTDTGWFCDDGNLVLYFPPRPFTQVPQELDNIFETDVDPRTCPLLAAHAGSYGAVTITPEGDVYVADPFVLVGLIYDCPPYEF